MKFFKRLVGVIALILGGVGTLACSGGFVGIWVVRARTDAMIGNVAERVGIALSTLEEKGQGANKRIEDVRNSVRGLNERVQQRVAELRGVTTEDAPDLDEIERQLYARIQLAKGWIGSIEAGVDLVEHVLQMLNSTTFFSQKESKTRPDIVAAVQAEQDEIDEVLRLAENVGTHLESIRTHRDLDESAAQIQTLSARIDESLEKIQRFGTDVETGIVDLRMKAADLASRIRRQILIVAVIVNLLLLWLVASQASLSIHGWHLVRS
jgi:chromosome segregation ATPase